MTNKVYIIKCSSYAEMDEKVNELLQMMGGIEQYAVQGESIALKVNLLTASEPEKAITTHPSLAAAVGRLAKGQGAKPFIIDSPTGAYTYNEKTLKRVYRTTGMSEAAQEAGIELNFDISHRPVSFLEGGLIHHFDILTPLVEADGVINLCKLKTHVLTSITGAVKNNFGAIPGRAKPGFHATLQDLGLFAQMLLDVADCVAPRLSIMDAVVGMEGDGPGNGSPRRVGLLLASENPLALDIVASEIMGIPPESNPILVEAEKRGVSPSCLGDIDLIGAEKDSLRIPDFVLPSTLESPAGLKSDSWLMKTFSPLFKNAFSLRPYVVTEDCIACQDCFNICPVQTITMEENASGKKYALINDDECIRCYCCHETCPQDAIELRKGLLYKVLQRV